MAEGDKRLVTLELNADTLSEAERMGPDLAATIERALRRDFPRYMTDDELELLVASYRTEEDVSA